MNQESCFNLGYIARRVGNHGELLFVLDVDQPSRYAKLNSVFIEINRSLVPFFITRIQIKGNNATVSLEGINTIEKADDLVRSSLYLPLEMLPPLSGKRFYFHEVKGFRVIDLNAGPVGTIAEVLDFPQQAIFRILNEQNQEILIPAREEFLKKIDREKKMIEVETPEGLLDVYTAGKEEDESEKEDDLEQE